MPKRVGYLYEKMLSKDAIRNAIHKGSIGKRKRKDVKRVMRNVDLYVDKVYELLVTGTFVPTMPKHRVIKDVSSGKLREISMVPFYPDGIMHQMLVDAMRPVLMRGMYHWSCASIPGRGNMHAIRYLKAALKKDRKHTKYCAKLDIYHYYPSLQPWRIMQKLRHKIKDEKFLSIIESILKTTPEGLAIGHYCNQWLANFFLEDLDRLICEQPGVFYYVRNMDDMVLIGPNKRKLHRAVRAMDTYLHTQDLRLKGTWQVFKIDSRGVDFVGYRFFHGYTLLRRKNFLRLRRQSARVQRLQKTKRPVPFFQAAGFISRAGQLTHCSGQHILELHVYPVGVSKMKNIVREEASHARNNTCNSVGTPDIGAVFRDRHGHRTSGDQVPRG